MMRRDLPAAVLEWIDEIADRFESAWQQGQTPRVADFLGDVQGERRSALLQELMLIDCEYHCRSEESAQTRQPRATPQSGTMAATPVLRCRACERPMPDVPPHAREVACDGCGSTFRVDWGTQRSLEYPRISDYEIIEVLGKGGMGVVYKARQVSLNRVVALKMLAGGQVRDEELARFRGEAEAVARLHHAHIVQIYEIGDHEGRPYLALEYMEGGSLAQCLAGTPLPPREAAELVRTLALAIDHAHQKGIIHRDLKPANILLNSEERGARDEASSLSPHSSRPSPLIPKISDFGLAKRLDAPAASSQTQTGAILGTPSYMAPEQAAGHVQSIGPAADVYALGAILYELLVGRPPFRAATIWDTIQQVMKDDPVAPRRLVSSTPRDVETICLKCLAKEPGKRYASAAVLAADLNRFLRNQPIRARRIGWMERTVKWARRHPTAASLVTIALLVVIGSVLGGLWYQEVRRTEQAEADVERLVTADIAVVPLLLEELAPYRRWTRVKLQQGAREGADDKRRLRASLALVDEDEGQIEFLSQRLLDCSVEEFRVIRDRLDKHHDKLLPDLQRKMQDRKRPDPAHAVAAWERQRLHAAMALAAYIPKAEFWANDEEIHFFLAQQLVRANPDSQRDLRTCLQPVYSSLVAPLTAVFHDPVARESERIAAAAALADYVREDPELLALLLSEASPGQYRILWLALPSNPAQRDPTIRTLVKLLREAPGAKLSESERVRLGRRRAGAAVALLRLGERETIFPAFDDKDDPETLTQFVHRLRDRDVQPQELLECLDRVPEGNGESSRFALLLALGEFELADLPDRRRKALLDTLVDWYRDDPSPGVHAACEWLLRRWRVDVGPLLSVDALPLRYDPARPRQWRTLNVGSDRLTLVECRPGSFTMGSPPSDPFHSHGEKQHRVRLTRTFAVCDREVTAGQWLQFLRETGHASDLPKETPSRSPHHPASNLTWDDAVAYCRWLTQKAGLDESQQCYVKSSQESSKDGTTNWLFHPERLGFRLPTEAEWEYACRAGTITTYSFGSDPSLLRHYAVVLGHDDEFLDHARREPAPCATKRPNRCGIFDMHGNVWEWCHDWKNLDFDDTPDPVGPNQGETRGYRGGSYDNYARHGRSACRIFEHPTYKFPYLGLRVVCTLQCDAGKGRP